MICNMHCHAAWHGVPCTQAAANAFAADFEAVLQALEADPLAPIRGHGSAPLNCIRLCALRHALLSSL